MLYRLKNFFINSGLFLLMLIFVIEPWVKLAGNDLNLSFLLSLMLFSFFGYAVLVLRKIPGSFFTHLTLLFSICLVYCFIHAAGTGFSDKFPLSRSFLILLSLFAFIPVFDLFRFFKRDILFVILCAFSFHAILIILEFLFIDFRLFIYEYLTESPSNITEESLIRMKGLALSSGAGLSVVQSFSFFAGFYLLDEGKRNKILILGMILLNLVSMMFIGRVGFYGFLASVVMWLFMNPSLFLRKIAYFSLYSVLLFACIYFLYTRSSQILNPIADEYLKAYVLPWLGEMLGEPTELGKSTVEIILHEMLFLPSHPVTLLFGDGFWTGVSGMGNYITSDSGYVRDIYALGLVGVFMSYSFLLYLIYRIFNIHTDTRNKIFVLAFSLYLLVVNIKEPFILLPQIVKLTLLYAMIVFPQAAAAETKSISS